MLAVPKHLLLCIPRNVLQKQSLHNFVQKSSLCVCTEMILLNNNLDRNSFGFAWVTSVIQFAAGPCFHMCQDNSEGGVEAGTSSDREGGDSLNQFK